MTIEGCDRVGFMMAIGLDWVGLGWIGLDWIHEDTLAH